MYQGEKKKLMNALISHNIDLIQWVSTLGLAPYYLILYMSFIHVIYSGWKKC